MGLVAAKCTQCGANIEVDDTKEAGICKYCGTAFITEKAINNYTINITNNNNFAGANIYVTGADIDELLKRAYQELKIENFEVANKYLDEIQRKNPEYTDKIHQLFVDVDILGRAYEEWNKNEDRFSCNCKGTERLELLKNEMKLYDSINPEVWVFLARTDFFADDIISYGQKAIIIASDSQKDRYKKIVYELFAEREYDGRIAASNTHVLDGIPKYYFESHDELVEDIIGRCKMKYPNAVTFSYQYKYLQSKLPNKYSEKIIETKKGCYIATCVYGSYDCPQVWTLRRFRDHTLGKTWYGRLFIKCYYAISPKLVKWLGETKWFRRFWKSKLDKMVSDLNDKGVNNTYSMSFSLEI